MGALLKVKRFNTGLAKRIGMVSEIFSRIESNIHASSGNPNNRCYQPVF
jgi:hypothetical protein